MRKKHILALLIVLVFATPVFAVFNERNLSRTLSVLRFELEQALSRDNGRPAETFHQRNEAQHLNLVQMMKRCNELSLILYSQDQDFTFDITYALDEVTSEYEAFQKQRVPYDDIMARLDLEIERYERLIEALRRLPPVLDELGEVPDSISMSKDSLMMTIRADSREHRGIDGEPPTHPSRDMHSDHDERRHMQLAAADAGHDFEKEDEKNLTNAIAMITGVEGHLEEEDDDDHDMRSFILDEHAQEDRDSCIACAIKILNNFKEMKEHAEMDTEHYEDMDARLKEAYDYAQNRYHLLQKRIFVEGQDNYFKVLSSFPTYVTKAWSDAKKKYGQVITPEEEEHHHAKSSWRGPIVVGFIFFIFIYLLFATIISQVVIRILSKKVKHFQTEEFDKKRSSYTLLLGVAIFTLTVMFARFFMTQNFFVVASRLLLVYSWLLLATVLSLVVRSTGDQLKAGVKLYTPVLLLGLVVIGFRIVFIPNRVLNLVYPPLMIAFAVWQMVTIKKVRKTVLSTDLTYAWLTLIIMVATSIVSLCGYVLLGVQVFIWWLFQLTAIATVTALYDLLKMFEKTYLKKALEEYRKTHIARTTHSKPVKGAYIKVTWFFDMIEMAVVPVIAGLSILVCIWFASGVFDLKEICKTIFFHPFFNLSDANGNAILHLSLFKLVLVGSLYFVFRYLSYLLKALYRDYKLDKTIKESGQDFIHANQVNLTLANNVIAIVIWGIYIIMGILLLKIPMGAISIVAAGLATGIGLALKDVLNNFIYGIQLMSGRLRVGDYIECDGVRGKVDSISYQSTQIETVDGAVMAFTNSSLFGSNFKNLTRNNSYELVKIPVGVGYGANVSKVRDLLSEALQTLQKSDKYGRYVLDPKKPITVAFADFGDSSVDLVVKQYVLVEEGPAYIAKAKEIIYNTLNENHIEIPFPQRDVYIRQIPNNQ